MSGVEAMNERQLLVVAVMFAAVSLPIQTANAIMAGDENALPADSPANCLDPLGAASPFNAIGSLTISAGGFSYIGSATAIVKGS